jgi:hypothetical protein
MRGPDSEPYEVTSDAWDGFDGWLNPIAEPISHVLCPCCKGLDERDGPRACLTFARVLRSELAATLSGLHGASGWCNQGEEAANTPGCLRCGDSGVVPCDEEEEAL